jgi:hypothetical protein
MKDKFEVGDLLYTWGSACIQSQIEKVVSITKAGNLKTDKGKIYYPTGRERGGSQYYSRCMRKARPEDIDNIKKRDARSAILSTFSRTSFSDLPLEALEAIMAIIKKHGKAPS